MNEPPSPTPRLAVARIGPATARGTVGSCCVHTPGAAEVEQIFSASTSFSGLSQTILDRTGQAIRDLSGRHLALFGCRVVIVVILGVVGDGQLVEHLVEITDGRGRRTAVRGLGPTSWEVPSQDQSSHCSEGPGWCGTCCVCGLCYRASDSPDGQLLAFVDGGEPGLVEAAYIAVVGVPRSEHLIETLCRELCGGTLQVQAIGGELPTDQFEVVAGLGVGQCACSLQVAEWLLEGVIVVILVDQDDLADVVHAVSVLSRFSVCVGAADVAW